MSFAIGMVKMKINLLTIYYRFTFEKDIAAHIKLEFEARFGLTWQCFVGNNFYVAFTVKKDQYFQFNIRNYNILLFKSG